MDRQLYIVIPAHASVEDYVGLGHAATVSLTEVAKYMGYKDKEGRRTYRAFTIPQWTEITEVEIKAIIKE